VFTQIETKKAAGKATAKAAAAKPAAGKAAPVGRVAAKSAPAAEPEAAEEETGEKTPVDNAVEIVSVFVGKQKSGSTIALSKMKGMIKMDFAKYKGADKDEVNAILSDDAQLALLGGEDFMNAFTVSEDGKTVTFN
jgi:NAD/NADP transhydrogenase beta subunit